MWFRYPGEIETSLLTQYGEWANIKHWHRLTLDEFGCPILSSRLLLELLEGLDEGSRFKTVAERDGDWTEEMRIAAETFAEITKVGNEVGKVVSVLVAAHGGSEYDDLPAAKYFPSPRQRRDQLDDAPVAPPTDEDIYMGMPA